MSEGDRRTPKLHKQPEIEDDDDEALSGDFANLSTSPNPVSAGIPCPTVEPATSSSEASPEDSVPPTPVTSSSLPSPMTRKQTLTRTPALEGTSPPPDSLLGQFGSKSLSQDGLPLPNGTSTSVSPDKGKKKGPIANQAKEFLLASHDVSSDSGRGTLDNDAPDIPMYTGDSKMDVASPTTLYKDSSGVDLLAFFKSTLHKSSKDRKTLLNLEKELITFIADSSSQSHKMTEMNTYDRMVAHRVAAYLGLDHNVDQSGKCIIVSRTAHTRIPETKFGELIDHADEGENQPKRKILQRKPNSLDEKQTWNSHRSQYGSITKAKSLEERVQNYSEVRQRIFKADETTADGTTGSSHLLSTHHPHMPQQRSLDSLRPNMQLLSSSTAAAPHWNSTDSSGYGTGQGHLRVGQQRATITKSHSYGGPASTLATMVLPLQHQQLPPSIAATTTSSSTAESVSTGTYESPSSLPSNRDPATPTGSVSDQSRSGSETGQSPMSQAPQYPTSFAYIITPDLSAIPAGSLIINPQTMEPYLNPDGSEYHFDPACPPPFALQSNQVTPQHVPTAGHPPTNLVYQNEPMSDLTSRFTAASLTPIEGLNPATPEQMAAIGVAGQQVALVPTYAQPTQAVLSSTQPTQFSQPVFYSGSATTGQPIRYVAYPLPHNSPQLATPATLEAQSQTQVPMPTVGVPAFSSAGGYQVITQPYPLPAGAVTNPQCYDLGNGMAYTPSPETNVVPGKLVSQPIPPTHNMVQTFSITPYPSNQQLPPQQPPQQQPPQQQQQIHQPIQHPQFQYTSHNQSSYSHSAPVPSAASFYTGVPLANPRPPSPHTQPPPVQTSSSHQQQPQTATVFYSPNIGSYPISPLAIPLISASGAATVKPNSGATVAQNQFRSPTPPQQQPQQPQQQHQQPMQPHQQQSIHPNLTHGHPQQQQTLPSNGVQPHAQVTVNIGQQPVSFPPNQAITAQQGSQFVALPGNYHPIRPMGTIFPVAASQAVAQPGGTSYQIVRAGRAVPGDVRMMPQSGLRPRIPSLPGSYGQHFRPKGSNQNRVYVKSGKKSGGRDNVEGSSPAPQPRTISTSQGTNPIAPSPLLPSAPSNRQ